MEKVTIQQINKFKVTIQGKQYDDFEEVDEWNGMLEFKRPDGSVLIVHKEQSLSSTFSSIFGQETKSSEVEFDVAKISPSLINTKT